MLLVCVGLLAIQTVVVVVNLSQPCLTKKLSGIKMLSTKSLTSAISQAKAEAVAFKQ
jgi:Tfp pilus assembly protein FimT